MEHKLIAGKAAMAAASSAVLAMLGWKGAMDESFEKDAVVKIRRKSGMEGLGVVEGLPIKEMGNESISGEILERAEE